VFNFITSKNPKINIMWIVRETAEATGIPNASVRIEVINCTGKLCVSISQDQRGLYHKVVAHWLCM